MSRTTIEERNESVDVSRLRPLHDYVLLRVIERERTSGGILLPKNKATELCLAEVVAVGTGIEAPKSGRTFPIQLVPGDTVLTLEWMGTEQGGRFELRDGKYRMVREHGIWAKVVIENRETYELASLTPRHSCVLIDPDDETKTRSGTLYLPNESNAQSEHRLGTVIVSGPGPWHDESGTRISTELKYGDRVVFRRYAGARVEIDRKDYRLMQADDVRCIAEGV